MALPKTLTTVTTFSKILAAIFFILFPLVGFYFGMQYQALVDQTASRITPTTEVLTQQIWKTYDDGNVKFEYPRGYTVGGTKDYPYIGRVGHTIGPNGSCVSDGIGIDIGGLNFKNFEEGEKSIEANLEKIETKNISDAKIYIGIQKPGQCEGVSHHIALMRNKTGVIVISLDGNNQDDVAAFDHILSTMYLKP